MSLIESMMEACQLIDKTRVSDGEGGFTTQWTPGATFIAAVTLDTTMQARIAEHEGLKSVYTVTTIRGVSLEYHDVFKRLSDGKVFRVTGDNTDKHTPDIAGLNLAQVGAEQWELTT